MIRSLPLFDTFRTALGAMANSVGGPAGLGALLGAHCRVGTQEAAQQLLDGTLEEHLAAQARLDESMRAAIMANAAQALAWTSSGASSGGDDDGDMG